MKKIMLVITQLEFGGAQKAIAVLANGLKEAGYNVDCYALYDKGGFVSEFEAKFGIKFKVILSTYTKGGLTNKLKTIKNIKVISDIVKKERYDIVQTFTHYSNIIIPVICISNVIKDNLRICTSQRASVHPLGNFITVLDRFVQNSFLVKKMICVSDGVYKSCIENEHINREKLTIIPNGIDANLNRLGIDNKLKDLIRGKFVFTTIARLHAQKGHMYLIDAIEKVSLTMPDSLFLLVGGGDLENKLKQIVNEKKISCIKFLGERNDIDSILSMSDCFILPSLWEGMPNVLLEAMKYKLCIIATRVEGSSEIVIDKKTGVLVSPSNSTELADAISFVYQNKKHAYELGEAGFQRVISHYSIEKYVQSFISLYES